MAYTNQTQIEAFLKRSLTANEQQQLAGIIVAVESYINDIIGGSFGTVDETTKYFDGGTTIIDIDPVQDVTQVALVNDDETVNHIYDLGEDFELRPRNETTKYWIESRFGKFPSGLTNIAITGKFTLGDLPDDIAYLATYLAGQLFSKNITSNLKSESIEGYSRTFNALIEENQVIKLVLDKYLDNEVTI